MLTDETRYRILKLLEADPHASQRRIADELGISLGRVNFCLRALIEKGLIKVNNFRNSANKRAYLYLLTPKGVKERATVTARFLRVKLAQYEALKHELEQLQQEAAEAIKPEVEELQREAAAPGSSDPAQTRGEPGR